MPYRTILADPPWPQGLSGTYKRKEHGHRHRLDYPTMSVGDIAALPVGLLALPGCHLWLWTTNQFLEAGFKVMRAWGFTYLAPIHWIKPSGACPEQRDRIGNWFVHRTQTLLFGYRQKCVFQGLRYHPNVIEALPGRHSQKPDPIYDLIEDVSEPRRLELFAREGRPGWDLWGNEVESSSIPADILGPAVAIDDNRSDSNLSNREGLEPAADIVAGRQGSNIPRSSA